jgi:hypothetical protein
VGGGQFRPLLTVWWASARNSWDRMCGRLRLMTSLMAVSLFALSVAISAGTVVWNAS